jgi:3-oxoacyl-[acyl-carrier protein] reductase
MDLGLTDRVALVAAGSDGLGLAVASALAAEGAIVSICGRDPDRLSRAVAALEAVAGPGRATGMALDVRDAEAVRGWVDGTATARGRLDVVVTNAGSPASGTATALAADGVRAAVELTLLSAVTMVNAALPHLRAGGWGRVLIVTSQSVKQPIPGLALSNLMRPALAGYAKTLVGELADSGVTVNVLAPGMTRTAALEEWAAELPDGLPGLAADIPLGRVAEPAEFGAVAAFLASERAGFVTGTVVPVDGGATRGLL